MKKRLVAFLLVLIMVLGMLPVSAFAADDGVSPQALESNETQTIKYQILYVGDEFNTGYSYGVSVNKTYTCQYSTGHSGFNHSILISEFRNVGVPALKGQLDSGYEFVGWAKEAKENPTIYDFNVAGTTATQTTYTIYLVAKKAVPPTVTYTLTYYPNTTDLVTNMPSPSPVTFTVSSKEPTRDGYTFLGWTGEGITTPQPNVTIPKGSTGDKTYIENWELTEYNITMDLNGGSGQEKVVYTMTDEDFELPTPTRNGYEFVGWTGERITTPQTSVKIPKGSTGNKAYTANWKVIRYTITLVTNGGAVIASIRYTVEDSVTLPIPPERPGYEFAGWTLDGSGQFPSTPMIIPKGSTGDRIYKAEWRVATYTITFVSHGRVYNWVQYTINNQVYFGTPEEDPSYYLPGYTFVGWKIDGVEGTPRSYMLPKGSYGNRTATMLWEAIP